MRPDPPTPPTPPTPQDENQPNEPSTPEEICLLCHQSVGRGQGGKSYKCEACDAPWCRGCVREVFLRACKHMYTMPPRCCQTIPLDQALPFFDPDEFTRIKEAYEEWQTPFPIYCPIPTCSAFISKTALAAPVISPSLECGSNGEYRMRPLRCPRCETLVCRKCKQVTHAGRPCPDLTEIDGPLLHQNLKRWGYKRCPGCGHSIRKMYGCFHMRCHCGTHFCWKCLEPYNKCVGCDSEFDEDVDDPLDWRSVASHDSLENLDQGSYGSDLDLGPEPSGAGDDGRDE